MPPALTLTSSNDVLRLTLYKKRSYLCNLHYGIALKSQCTSCIKLLPINKKSSLSSCEWRKWLHTLEKLSYTKY